jgi:hypothetical protein
MAIDSRIEAYRTALENDRRASPNAGGMAALRLATVFVKNILLGPYAKAAIDAKGDLFQRSLCNLEELLAVVEAEFNYVHCRIDELSAASEAHRRFREEELPGLAVDACHKAEATRAKDRIHRIGRILVNSLVADQPPLADEVEELMRLATILDDRDVFVIGLIYAAQHRLLCLDGRAERDAADDAWPDTWHRAAQASIPAGEFESRCSKLAGLGLIRLLNITKIDVPRGIQPSPPPFGLLKRGADFVELACPEIAKES